jgi:hypothetical protein
MSVVDRARAILKSRAAISREMLEPLVEDYSEQVGQVNERLQRCEGLLRKGLRSEALQLAELEPRLLDQVALLDFPELEDWEEILRFYGLEVPTSLLLDVALQIQDAMISEQPLSVVMKQHRKLAIARAPLAWRLRVLRQIERLDPGNPNWSEDVEAWEKVRLKELDREVDEAILKADLERCEGLKEEVQSEGWHIRPPETLLKRLDERISGFRVSRTLKQLEALAGRLNAAFCEMDAAQGKLLAEDWHITSMGVSQIPRSIFQMAEPALAWVEEMRKEQLQRENFEALSQQLRESLNDRAKVTDVMRLHQALVRLDLGVDPSLQRLYESFLENRRIEGQRRTRLAMAGILGSVLIAAGLVGFFLWQRADYSREMAVVGQIKGLVDSKKFEEAAKFIEQMNSSTAEMMKRPTIAKLVEEVNQWKVQEEDRRKQFEDYIARADSEVASMIDLETIVQAERLARTESEKGRAFALRKRFTEWDDEVKEKQRSDAEKGLADVNGKIKSMEAMDALEVKESEFDVLDNELSDLASKYPKAGDVVFGDIKLTRKKLEDLEKSVRELKNRTKMGEEVIQEIRSSLTLQQLSESLKKFNERVAGVKLNPEFDSVLAEQDAWKAVENWNDWATNFGMFLKGSSGGDESALLASTWKDKIQGIQGLAQTAYYPELTADLNMVGTRSSVLDEYVAALTDSSWAGVGTVVITKTDGGVAKTRRFTYAAKAKDIEKKSADSKKGKSVGIEVIVEGDGTYGNWSPEGEFSYVPEPDTMLVSIKEDIEKRRPAFERNWEREWLGLMARIVKDTNIDVMVKEELILQMLETMQKGSVVLAPLSEQVIGALKSTKRERADWFEPLEYKTAFSESIRDQLQVGFRKVVERDGKFSAIAATRIAFAGVVLPSQEKVDSEQSVPVIRTSSQALPVMNTSIAKSFFALDALPDKAQLVYFRKEGTNVVCSVLGTIESGAIKIDANSFRATRFGTPIFAITE